VPRRGGRGDTCVLLQFIKDCRKNAVHILENLGIPKSQHSKPKLLKRQRSESILDLHLVVLTTVELYDQSTLKAAKVDDKGTERTLPAEPEAGKLPFSDSRP